MHPALTDVRPPYVEFETRAEEDRDATIREGRLVLKDVDYAIIRAIGSKDCVEKRVDEWLAHLDKLAAMGEYPVKWRDFFHELYREWKAGHELPVDGFPIREWPAISRAQAEACIAARVRTVEDLAVANEETLQRIGIGARQLKERARAWLEMAAKNGNAEELAALRAKTVVQEQQIADMAEKVKALSAQLHRVSPGRSEADVEPETIRPQRRKQA